MYIFLVELWYLYCNQQICTWVVIAENIFKFIHNVMRILTVKAFHPVKVLAWGTRSTLLIICEWNPPVKGPHKGPAMRSFDFYLLLVWIIIWKNSQVAVDLRRHDPHVTLMGRTEMWYWRAKKCGINVQWYGSYPYGTPAEGTAHNVYIWVQLITATDHYTHICM